MDQDAPATRLTVRAAGDYGRNSARSSSESGEAAEGVAARADYLEEADRG